MSNVPAEEFLGRVGYELGSKSCDTGPLSETELKEKVKKNIQPLATT